MRGDGCCSECRGPGILDQHDFCTAAPGKRLPFSVDRATGHGDGEVLHLGQWQQSPSRCHLLEDWQAIQSEALLGQQQSTTVLCCNCPTEKHLEEGSDEFLGWHCLCWSMPLPV